ncbi:thermonuclease family protein [Winogradskyella tangerina]|uniref:thermonuclease family protein n=1 Tax=Winogradskyella tangerina TaxID=2023240 RepID=UPI000DBE2270|nr:thermonuclease family protein [Winogradskyella tangerina]
MFKYIIIILFTLNSFAQSVEGKVVAITDGDTFKLLQKDSTLVRVRVANIDCPERKQPFSKRAKQFTSDAIFSKNVELKVLKKDRYGRSIAYVFYNNKNLGEELLKAGLAWHYVKYSDDESLQNLEDKAREKKVGLWSDPNAIAPWDWRSQKKSKHENAINQIFTFFSRTFFFILR